MRPIASAYRKICIDIRCNSVEPVQSGVGEGKHRVVSRQTWSPGAERLKRYSADQIIGKHFSVFHPQTDVPAGKPAHELKTAAEVGPRRSGLEIRQVDSPAGISVATVPLIMLSSSRHAVDIQRAYQVGANSYQVKPATSDALLSVMTVLKTYCFQNNQNLTGGIQT